MATNTYVFQGDVSVQRFYEGGINLLDKIAMVAKGNIVTTTPSLEATHSVLMPASTHCVKISTADTLKTQLPLHPFLYVICPPSDVIREVVLPAYQDVDYGRTIHITINASAASVILVRPPSPTQVILKGYTTISQLRIVSVFEAVFIATPKGWCAIHSCEFPEPIYMVPEP